MGNCAACADQAGGTDGKLTELPDSLAFTELTQMHYIEQATEAGGPAKVQKPINLRFRIVSKSVFPELYDQSLKEKKEALQKGGLLEHTPTILSRAILYKVAYGSQVQIWEEEVRSSADPFVHSQTKVLEYDFLEGETIRIEVAMADTKLKLKDKATFDGFVEFNIHTLIRSSKDKSLKLRPVQRIEGPPEPSNQDKRESLGFLTLDLREHRRQQISTVRLSLQGSEFPKSKNLLSLTLFEQVGSNKIPIYESPLVQRIQEFFSFNGVEFKSDLFTTTPLEKVHLTLAVREEKEPSVFRDLGEAEFLLGNFLANQKQVLNIVNTSGKAIGKIKVKDFSMKPFHSFLDYLSTGLKIVPIVAIDFSLTNITFDEKTVLHSLSSREFKAGMGPQNPYISALRAISRVHSGISEYAIPIGFGARTVPGESPTSDCFAVNFNLFKPTVPISYEFNEPHEELEKAYGAALKKIELSAPVHYRQMLSLSCDFAEYALYEKQDKERDVPRNFYVLYLLTVGLVDDYEESIKQLVRGIELPLVIVIIKMGKQDLEDMKDVEDVVMRCGSHYSENERRYIEIIDFEKVVRGVNKDTIFTDTGSFANFSRSKTNVGETATSLESSLIEERARSGTVSKQSSRLLSEKDEEDAISKQITANLAHQVEEYMNGRELYPKQAKKEAEDPVAELEVWNHIEEEFWLKVNESLGSDMAKEARNKITSATGLPEASLEVLNIVLRKQHGIDLNIDIRKGSAESGSKFSQFSEYEEEEKTGIPKSASQLKMDEQIRQISAEFQQIDMAEAKENSDEEDKDSESETQEFTSVTKKYSDEVTSYVKQIVRIASNHDVRTLRNLNPKELDRLTSL